jgi:uncharacterized protein YndB with AHSA1/START domain
VTTSIEQAVATQAYKVYVKASPEAIWDTIKSPDQAQRYGHRSRVEYELRPGDVYRAFANEGTLAMGAPDVIIAGEVVETDAPRRLVQTWSRSSTPRSRRRQS